MELRGRGEGRDFMTLAHTGPYTLLKSKSNIIKHKQCSGASTPHRSRLDIGDDTSYVWGTGASLAWHSSTAPSPAPRINKCSISHPLASGKRWEIHLNLLCSYPKWSTWLPLGRSRGALSSHFWLSVFFSWLERHWSACTSYQRPAEWVEIFSKHEICHTCLKSTMSISK